VIVGVGVSLGVRVGLGVAVSVAVAVADAVAVAVGGGAVLLAVGVGGALGAQAASTIASKRVENPAQRSWGVLSRCAAAHVGFISFALYF
jgi:hypothetical protein